MSELEKHLDILRSICSLVKLLARPKHGINFKFSKREANTGASLGGVVGHHASLTH